ncbi:MAG TPA: PAS domain-containing protein, partial [Anaeromyxobacteraceae bacterium]|nr:PAS domain-containing protein [Anaeromyxobacteraceae bacterium]
MKLRHKLLLAFLLLAVVPLAAVVALFQLSFTPQAERLVGSRLQDNAAQTAQLLDEFVATCVRDFRALAAAEEMVSDSPAVVADHLARHTHAYPHFRRVMLADTSGVIVASSDPGTTGRRLVELHGELADDFRTVLQHPPGRMQVSDLTDLADAAAPDAPPPLDLQLLLRVQDEAGRPRGVLVAVMESRRLLEQIDDIDRRMPAEVPGYLLDRGGRVLLTRDASANPLGAYPDVEPVLEHLRATNWHGEGWLTQPHVHEQEVLTAYAVTSEFGDNRAGRWLVVLRAPRHVVMAPVDFITSRVLALLLGVLAVAAGVSFWLARPVTDLARLVERLRKGDLSARALVARRGEAGLVARELNEMAAAVQHRTRQLTESEAKWRTLFDEATDGLILVDPATQTFRQVNRSICRMLGTTEAELVARGLDGIPPAEQLPAVQETFARMGLGTQKAAVLPLLRKHGGVLLADVTASILEVGGQRLLLAAFRDITERRRMEESLRQNEERLQLSLHAAKAGIWDWDIPADRTVWSARCYALYGLPPSADPLKLEGWLALVHPDDRDRVAERARQTLAERRTAFAQEYRIVHPQEGLRWLSDTGQVTFDAAGTPLRAIGLIFDVTERKQAEAELERMRVLLSEGLRIARCGVFEYVPATGEMIWSEEQFRIYGLPPGPRSPSFHDLVHEHLHPADAARVEQAFQAAVQGGATFDIEHRIVRHDGTVRDVHDVAHPYFDAQGKVLKYTGATLDVTERKRTQETLDEARRRLETIVTSSTAMLYACQATGNFDATFVSRNFQ